MQDAFRALIDNYCVTLARQLDDISRYLDAADRRQGDSSAALEGVLDLSHQIAGLSGTMGYAHVGTAAAELEAALVNRSDGPEPSSPEGIAQIKALYDVLSHAASGVKPENSTLYNIDLSHLARGLG